MTPQPTPATRRLVKGALRGALFTALFLALVIPLVAPAAAAPGPTRQGPTRQTGPRNWDHDNVTIPCDGKEIVTFDPDSDQSALARYDDASLQVVTVVVFFDAGKVEEDGRAFRYHFSTTTSALTWEIHSADVTVMAASCSPPPTATPVPPTPTKVPPTPTKLPAFVPPGLPPIAPPVVWEFTLVVPCGADPEIAYNPWFGFAITWIGPAQDHLIFDAWQDDTHIVGSGHDKRTDVQTNHGFAGCKLFWTNNKVYGRYTVSFFARLPNTQPSARPNT